MRIEAVPHIPDLSRGSGHGGGAGGGLVEGVDPPPRVSIELIERFRVLVEDVTEELMRAGTFDRSTCRADAIALLVAASDDFDEGDEAGESPLRYLLLEEQRKAAAFLHDASVPPGALMKV